MSRELPCGCITGHVMCWQLGELWDAHKAAQRRALAYVLVNRGRYGDDQDKANLEAIQDTRDAYHAHLGERWRVVDGEWVCTQLELAEEGRAL